MPAGSFTRYSHQRVVLGIRPEDLALAITDDGDSLALHIEPDRIHLFDLETEKRLM